MSTLPPTPAPTDKAGLRRHYRLVRGRAVERGGRALHARIGALAAGTAGELLGLPAPSGPLLGVYWPLAGEIDLLALAERRPVALPAIHDQRLVYRPWQPGQPLQPDACGIPAPAAEAGELEAEQLGLLLVPALAIDPSGLRLGYGGGWYDRLRAAPRWRRLPALAVLPAACCAASLPRDPWDVPLAGWISEQGYVPALPPGGDSAASLTKA